MERLELTPDQEILCMRFFMQYRVDYDGDFTVLEKYEECRDLIIKQLFKERF